MNSSPATPAGTRPSCRPSTYTRVLPAGRPTGSLPSARTCHGWEYAVTSIVASVGPYTLCSGTASRRASAAATSPVSCSPPQTTCRTAAHRASPATAVTSFSTVGTRASTLTPPRAAASTSTPASPAAARGATTSEPPAASPGYTSIPNASKLGDDDTKNRSPSVTANRRLNHATYLTSEPCPTITPFGCPADPDV